MTQKKTVLLAAACFCAGIAAAVLLRLMPMHHGGGHGAHLPQPPQAAFNLLQQPLQSVQGEATSLTAEVAGQETLLVNFWATWCAPCLHEMPLLQAAAKQHGVRTVGISYEEIAVISNFLARLPVEYPLYRSSFDIFYFFQQEGNRGGVLPYTVLVDASGKVLRSKLGEFKTVQEVVDFAGGGGA